jgi:hypothetical protein
MFYVGFRYKIFGLEKAIKIKDSTAIAVVEKEKEDLRFIFGVFLLT